MSNFELIDDYLTNRLSEADRKAFENQIAADPSLRADVEAQSHILDGIKKARTAELKSMLAKVHIESTPASFMNPVRIAAGIVGAAVIAGVIIYFGNREVELDNNNLPASTKDSRTNQNPQNNPTELTGDSIVKPSEDSQKISTESAIIPEKSTGIKPVAPVKPKIDLIDPSQEITNDAAGDNGAGQGKVNETPSKVEVEIEDTNRKFNFHYQFQNGKLRLYGNFKNGLYEIIEINSDHRALFLYYREGYYLLDEKNSEVTPLELIKDQLLLQKLKSYREN
jgi:hypothetical protein